MRDFSLRFLSIFLLFLCTIRISGYSEEGSAYRYAGESARSSDPDLEAIREKVIQDLLAPPLDEAHIRALLETIRKNGSWPHINYEDLSRTGFEHSVHLHNMYQLARAYKRPGSLFYQSKKVRDAAMQALDFWLKNDFICDNWWWNEMGTPHAMINTLLVLDTDLTETQAREGLRISGRANLEASGARPGGDLIQIAGMLAKQALFRRDATVMKRVVDVMSDEIQIANGRGLQADMSFHHRVDKVICTLSYGLGYAKAFAYWAVKTAGTRYALSADATRLLTDYFLDGICKSMVHARYPDPGAKNRDLSRKGTLAPTNSELAENLLAVSDHRKQELKQIIKIQKGAQEPKFSSNWFYWHSEYFTHQRPGYFSSVRMHSSRNHTMEQPHNEEGLKMHHVGDGAHFISPTGKEYFDIFPVWDWQKIPGTTVVQKPVHPHWHEIAKKGLTDFVGGVSDGFYGAAAFDFQSAHDPLKARKAWFFFDEEIVCLGTGISSTASHPVVTTVNQCLLDGEVKARWKKGAITLEKGDHALPRTSWVAHGGVGYFFFSSPSVRISNRMATGTWREINHQARTSPTPVEKEVFMLWLEHGVKPEQAEYAYVVLPGASEESLNEYEHHAPVQVLSNTRALQAVLHAPTHRAEVVFYEPGTIKFENTAVTAEAPCLVMIKTNGKTVESITVSDPSRKRPDVRLRIDGRLEGSGTEWRAVWNKKEKETVIDVRLPEGLYAGQSVVISFPPIQ